MKNLTFFCALVCLFAVLFTLPAVAQTANSRGNTRTQTPSKGPKNKQQPKPKPSGNTEGNSASMLKTAFSFRGGINLVTDGGSLGIDAFPNINFHPTQRFNANAGPVYQLRQANGNAQQIFGARASANYQLLPGLYANAGWETMNVPNPNYVVSNINDPAIAPQPRRLTTHRLPLGAGFTQRLFGINVDVAVMYDLLYRKNSSPYATPYMFRGGVFLGNKNRQKNKSK